MDLGVLHEITRIRGQEPNKGKQCTPKFGPMVCQSNFVQEHVCQETVQNGQDMAVGMLVKSGKARKRGESEDNEKTY